jgi:hypothetical protein
VVKILPAYVLFGLCIDFSARAGCVHSDILHIVRRADSCCWPIHHKHEPVLCAERWSSAVRARLVQSKFLNYIIKLQSTIVRRGHEAILNSARLSAE